MHWHELRPPMLWARLLLAVIAMELMVWQDPVMFGRFQDWASSTAYFPVQYPFWGTAIEPLVVGVLIALFLLFVLGNRVRVKLRWALFTVALVLLGVTGYCAENPGAVPFALIQVYDQFYLPFIAGFALVFAILRRCETRKPG